MKYNKAYKNATKAVKKYDKAIKRLNIALKEYVEASIKVAIVNCNKDMSFSNKDSKDDKGKFYNVYDG